MKQTLRTIGVVAVVIALVFGAHKLVRANSEYEAKEEAARVAATAAAHERLATAKISLPMTAGRSPLNYPGYLGWHDLQYGQCRVWVATISRDGQTLLVKFTMEGKTFINPTPALLAEDNETKACSADD